jgi:MFS family permease
MERRAGAQDRADRLAAVTAAVGRYPALLRDLPRDVRLYLLAQLPLACGAGVFATVYGLYVLALGHGPAFLGMLLTGALAGAGASAFPAGALVDRLGPRPVLLGGCVVAAAGVAVQLATAAPAPMLVSSVLAGAGTGAFTLAAAPFLAQHIPPDRGAEVYTLDLIVGLAGRMAGSVAGGQLAARLPLPDGWPAAERYWLTLLCASAFATLAFGILLQTRRALPAARWPGGGEGDGDAAPAPQPAPGGGPPWLRAAGHPVVVRLAVVALLTGLGSGLFLPYVGVFFVESLRTSAAAFGWLSAAALALQLVASVLAPALARALGAARTVGGAQLASVPLLLLMGFAPSVAVAGAALLLRRALMNVASPVLTALTMDVLPADLRGAGNAVVWVGLNGAAGLSTLAGGALIAALGYRPPYVLAALLYAAAALLFLRWFARPERPAAVPRVA